MVELRLAIAYIFCAVIALGLSYYGLITVREKCEQGDCSREPKAEPDAPAPAPASAPALLAPASVPLVCGKKVPGPVEQHIGLNIAPGKRACDIQTKPVGMTRRAEVNCNVQCYSHPECVAFVMGFDGRGHPKCYMKAQSHSDLTPQSYNAAAL